MEHQEAFYHDLKQLRIAQGISLEDIADKTRINRRFLEAIEEGDFAVLPSTYIRLFLRSYCQEIGSNFDDVVTSLEEYIGQLQVPHTPDQTVAVSTPEKPERRKADDTARAPARLRRDFITGAAIFITLIVLTIFARKTYVEPALEQEAVPTQVAIPTETAAQPAEETPAPPPATVPETRRTRASRPVVPVESSVELANNLFRQDRIISHLLERVRLTPPVRLTLMARDNVVIQPVTQGQPGPAFNLTVAEARQWTVDRDLILRTPTIHLLRGDLNGVPIDFGEANGLGALRITPTGIYEVSSYAPPD
ncbi:MAG: helix-turn-helix domain-containing protein [Candidatus Marinimicrobia bacterium]|nr:helix-turn-helix domain-containing protein [Candidatus Neomarinimicrobiota bacterium]